MQAFHFTGRAAARPTTQGSVTKVTLISNEYAGKDESGAAKERQVSIQFTVFGSRGASLAENLYKGDQLNVIARIENNNYTDNNGDTKYGYSFIVDEYEYGAPGQEKRRQLAEQNR